MESRINRKLDKLVDALRKIGAGLDKVVESVAKVSRDLSDWKQIVNDALTSIEDDEDVGPQEASSLSL